MAKEFDAHSCDLIINIQKIRIAYFGSYSVFLGTMTRASQVVAQMVKNLPAMQET